jgi:hypothetical protein
MKLQTKYVFLKATTIFFGALSIPWSTFTGFCFGDGRYYTGLISLAAQTAVALVDGYIWFWVLENMKTRIQGEGDRVGIPSSNRRVSSPSLPQNGQALTGLPSANPAAIHVTTQLDGLKKDFVTDSLKLEMIVQDSPPAAIKILPCQDGSCV